MRKSGPAIFLVFLAGALVPVLAREYQVNLLTEVIIFALFAVSFNLLLGYGGLLSFGHAMFFGFGAFIAAISIVHMKGISLAGCLLIVVASSIVVGFAVGSLLLRLKGSYWSLLTMAFNALFYAIATKWQAVTGGDDGLSIARPAISLGFKTIKVNGVTSFYYLALVVIGAVIVFCWYFTHTAMGQTVILMRENEERMKFLGFNTALGRLILLGFSAGLAGLAGGFYALHFQFVSVSAVSLEMGTISF